MAKIFEKLIFGGLHEKHAMQRGIWVPTQYSLEGVNFKDWYLAFSSGPNGEHVRTPRLKMETD
jgi:hypothetical protein